MFDNTTTFINKFESLLESSSPTREEKDFVNLFELEISKALLNDLESSSIKKIGKFLVTATKD